MKHSKRRLITFTRSLATAMVLVMLIAFSADAGGGRRLTGNGDTLRFSTGERVAGEIITLRKRDGTWGRTYYHCFLQNPFRPGRVTSGVINYFQAEVKNLPNCKDTLSSPGPRKEAGEDGRHFQKGDHVLGFAIEINVDPRGRTYFSCAIVKAEADGFVYGGVVNPSRFEIKKEKRCSNTDNWNPGFRVESGGGNTIHFYAGERILGAYIKYDDGTERYNCYDRVADMDGVLTSGVVNYWPMEATPPYTC